MITDIPRWSAVIRVPWTKRALSFQIPNLLTKSAVSSSGNTTTLATLQAISNKSTILRPLKSSLKILYIAVHKPPTVNSWCVWPLMSAYKPWEMDSKIRNRCKFALRSLFCRKRCFKGRRGSFLGPWELSKFSLSSSVSCRAFWFFSKILRWKIRPLVCSLIWCSEMRDRRASKKSKSCLTWWPDLWSICHI